MKSYIHRSRVEVCMFMAGLAGVAGVPMAAHAYVCELVTMLARSPR